MISKNRMDDVVELLIPEPLAIGYRIRDLYSPQHTNE
jgi:hypothetical protein